MNYVSQLRNLFKFSKPRETTRTVMIERLYKTGIRWNTKIDNDVMRTIDEQLEMVKLEWSIKVPTPNPFIQTLPEHIEEINKAWNPYYKTEREMSSYPFVEVKNQQVISSLSARQMCTYVNALSGLEQNKYEKFFHEFFDFIHNYSQNIKEPINVAEKMALGSMIVYYSIQKYEIGESTSEI